MTERESPAETMRAAMTAAQESEPGETIDETISAPAEAAPDESAATPAEAKVDSTGRAHGPDGKFSAKETKVEDKPRVEASAEPKAAGRDLGPLEPPHKWPLEQQQLFRKQPKEVQEWMMARDKEVGDAYGRKTSELAEQRRQFEPLAAIAQQRDLQRHGVTPAQYFSELDRVYNEAIKRPDVFVQQFARQFGVDLAGLVGGARPAQPADDYNDPTVVAMQAEIAGLKQQLGQVGTGVQAWQQQQQAMQRQQIESSLVQQINAFASATDQAGNPIRPYFEEVADDMVLHLNGLSAMGRQPTLQDLETAYNRAVWGNDATRAKLEAAREAQATRQRQEEARKHATAARKASTSITGTPAGSAAPAPARDATEEFRRNFDRSRSVA